MCTTRRHASSSRATPSTGRRETLLHWGHKENLFTLNITKPEEFDALKKPRKGKGEVRVFNFDELYMLDDEGHNWHVKLGDYVKINDPKCDETGEVKEDFYVARVVELFVDPNGNRRMVVHWMYRLQDTLLAVPCVKEEEGEVGKKRKRQNNTGETMMNRLPLSGDGMPSCRVWLCGSMAENERCFNTYDINYIDEPVHVYHVRAGTETVEDVQEQLKTQRINFDPSKDFWYNQFTLQDFYTFKDLPVDITPWSAVYREIWDKTKGPQRFVLIKQLRGELTLGDADGGFGQLMSLCRGAAAAMGLDLQAKLQEKLQAPADLASSHKLADGKRVIFKLELFCGGGGLSYMSQQGDNVKIVSCWANAINPSACATYVCNKPYAIVSCCGLEDLNQLAKKFGAAADLVLGKLWRQSAKLQLLLALPPGKRNSRMHLPEGVGCGGGMDLRAAEAFVESATKGEAERKARMEILLPLVGKSKEEVAAALGKLDPGDADLAAATGRKPISNEDVERVVKEVAQLQEYLAKHDPAPYSCR